ncbi:hypothetical protein Arad_12228 (plasmid) [Rhizobium rhizogenes K84]|uniref:Uncharacterized protein n=1 Tax=Rhizobium rhizogenes (strain K84 / ATCC BAA-868) TaxID=311403 RepID=B9JQ36_RHIR8|nr:hypothetical protein Arad_12228 [Rhizobium rhizogenes K84]
MLYGINKENVSILNAVNNDIDDNIIRPAIGNTADRRRRQQQAGRLIRKPQPSFIFCGIREMRPKCQEFRIPSDVTGYFVLAAVNVSIRWGRDLVISILAICGSSFTDRIALFQDNRREF